MKTSKTPKNSKPGRVSRIGVLALSALVALPAFTAKAVNWIGGTASYNTPADWANGSVPGVLDNAVNNNGINNVVQINSGDPNWTVISLWAGRGGNGAFLQNGPTLTLTTAGNSGTGYAFNIGDGPNDVGVYTLNSGTINYGSAGFNAGMQGQSTFNMNGGTVFGSGNFADNVGAAPSAVTATMDGGISLAGTTWYEQGFNTGYPTVGVPPHGSTVTTNISGVNYTYTFASDYTTNDVVMIDTNDILSATITPTTPVVCSALSFLGSAGDGPVTVNYKVQHADGTSETGNMTFLDWFNTAGTIVLATDGRANGDGSGVSQFGSSGFPFLFAVNVSLANTTSPVTNIVFTSAVATNNGEACVMAVSSSTGGDFSPVAFKGYNEDMIIEAGAQTTVSSAIVDTVNQTAGAIIVTNGGQFFVGNIGNAVYNMSGGSVDVYNYIAIGRSGGVGTLNMTGGTFNQDNGGNLLVGTGYNAGANTCYGTVNQSGGTVNCLGQLLIPENSPAVGSYNLSGTGTVNVNNNWLAVGRGSAKGYLNITNGTVIKSGGNTTHFDVGAGGIGVVNQYGGVVSNTSSDFWLAESAAGTWNFNGGQAFLGNLVMGADSSSAGTLNLNGGVFQATQISSPSFSVFNYIQWNAATLQANANSATFITNINSVVVGPGAVIDSQNYGITIPQELDDNGGGTLTKIGTGTVTLTGPNTYSGATTVNNGTLVVSTVSQAGGGYAVADNATLGVSVASAGGQLNVSSLTLGNTSGATLSFDLGGYGNPAAAPINVSGATTVNGVTVINIVDALPQSGQFPLIKLGSGGLVISGGFTLGSLPVGVSANLVTNVVNSSIDLNITSVNLPVWSGTAGGNWDIGLTMNWDILGSSTPTYYGEGNAVRFDDSATGTPVVNLVANVHPSSILFTNNTVAYTVVGTGTIGGTVGLNKQGSNSVAILNAGGNTYTGPTVITGGTLSVTNLANGGSPSAIGASSSSAANLVISGATFQYAGAPVTINRSYTATNAIIDTEGNLTLTGTGQVVSGTLAKVGPATMTYAGAGNNQLANAGGGAYQVNNGTVIMDGSAGNQTNIVSGGDAWVGSTVNTGANLILTNTTLTSPTWLAIGRGNGALNNTSTVTAYNSKLIFANVSLGYNNGLPNLAQQFLTLNGNSTLTDGGAGNLGESAGSTVTVNLNDTSVFTTAANCLLGGNNPTNTDTGYMTINNSARLSVGSYFSIGNGQNCVGMLTVKSNGVVTVGSDLNVGDNAPSTGYLAIQDNASVTAVNTYLGRSSTDMGYLTIQGNGLLSGAEIFIGSASSSTGLVTMTGGTVISRSGDFRMGGTGNGTWNQTGGTMITTNWISIGRDAGSVGLYNISGGSLVKVASTANNFNLGENGTGTLNISGTANVNFTGALMNIGIGNSGIGLLNLNGGTLTGGQITAGTGSSTFNFNGGTLVAANGANANFFINVKTVNVQTNGAIINSGTNAIIVAQPLLNAGGGLTKLGSGALYMNGASTYTNTTLVSAGTLAGSGTLASAVTIASGAALGAGTINTIGTLTINNSLTFATGSTAVMKLTTTNSDMIAGLTGVNYTGAALVITNTSGAALTPGHVYQLFNSATAGVGGFSSVTILPSGTGTFNPANGTLTIAAAFNINPVKVSGGNLIVTASGGTANGGYTLLQTTNLLTPLASWTTNLQGTLDATGSLSNAIPVSATTPAQFFRVRQP